MKIVVKEEHFQKVNLFLPLYKMQSVKQEEAPNQSICDHRLALNQHQFLQVHTVTMERLSTATRHKVIQLPQQGLCQATISKQTGVSRHADQALLQKHKVTGSTEDHRHIARPRNLSAADDRHFMFTSFQN